MMKSEQETYINTSENKPDNVNDPVSNMTVQVHQFKRAVFFLGSRAVQIALTIFAGIFLTVLLASNSGQMEKNARLQVDRYVMLLDNTQFYAPNQTQDEYTTALRASLEHEAGLDLPFWPRQVKWTLNALQLDWGRAVSTNMMPVFSLVKTNLSLKEVLVRYLPNTILLAGSAIFLVFIFGIPLALFLSRNYGKKLDRIFSMLVPISSVPSWVHAVLLISVFAVQLRLLPVAGMFETQPPEQVIGYIPIVLRHMVLPVLAIFLSMFFQLAYTWRTYFLIYSEEDYVVLGKAKGLPEKELQMQYILKPALTYVITSFALTLVGFWQAIMALEVVFDWPGLGWLYIKKALPNFWGESMYQGDLVIAIGVVVIFAYMLGVVVFILDLIYLIVDPRIQLINHSQSIPSRQPFNTSRIKLWQKKPKYNHPLLEITSNRKIRDSLSSMAEAGSALFENIKTGFKSAASEIFRSPLAIIGLSIIFVLLAGSVYAVIALPYEKIGGSWARETLTGRSDIPRLAQPAWINLFRDDKLLSVLSMSSGTDNVPKKETVLENGFRIVTYEFNFDYPFSQAPAEIQLYLDAEYQQKRPFITAAWYTPDGRKMDLKSTSPESPEPYNFSDSIPYKRLVWANPKLQKWFVMNTNNPTPAHYLLFMDPNKETPVILNGSYKMVVSGMFFEKTGDLKADLVLLGQVYGPAGTDYLRRNLLVPLLWGLPFALLFGLLGAVVTTVLSMVVAASGVWFGGWVDSLTQRLTEANMIMPVLAISVLAHALLGISLWVILGIVVLLNIFGSPTKTFRSAFLQLKDAPYIEAARAYGASSSRIIMLYMLPRIVPVLVPQLVTLIPSYVFLEATLGMFNIKSEYPTWGTVIYRALTKGALWGAPYWVLEPLGMLLLTGLAFAMLGYALERILNPRLREQ